MGIWEFLTSGSLASTIAIAVVCIGFVVLTFVLLPKKKNEPEGQVTKVRAGAVDTKRDKTLSGVKKALGSFASRGENKTIFGPTLTDPKSKDKSGVYVDAITIGYYGATVFVGCDLAGDVYLSADAPQISCVVVGEKMRIENPHLVAKNAARILREILKKHEIYRVPVNEVVVATNQRAKVIAPRSLEFSTPKTIGKTLASAPYSQDNDVDVAAVYEAIAEEVSPK